MRGRVFGLTNAGAWAGVPLGALLGGIAVETVGFTVAFGVVAVVYTLATLTPLTGGNWRLMERASPAAPTAAVPPAPARGRRAPRRRNAPH